MKDEQNMRHKNEIWFVKDVCGIICAIFSYVLIIFAQYVLITVIWLPEENTVIKSINILIFEFFVFLAFAAHLRTMFTDPGSVPKGTATKEALEQLGLIDGQVHYKCPKCSCIKNLRSHHCSICKRCILKMDHHCPWINNCVGQYNQKFFVLFTFYIAIISIHALIMVFNHFMKCLDNEWKLDSNSTCGQASTTTIKDLSSVSSPISSASSSSSSSTTTAPINIILLICVVFEGLLFAIFTIIMFAVQMQAIWNDETSIEQLKKESATATNQQQPQKRSWNRRQGWRNIRAVFGLKGFSLSWFSPFTRIETITYVESDNYTV